MILLVESIESRQLVVLLGQFCQRNVDQVRWIDHNLSSFLHSSAGARLGDFVISTKEI